MSIQDIKNAKHLREQGLRLGRAGLSERVDVLVRQYLEAPSPKAAMALAGRLHAVALAARCDTYWHEKTHYDGFHRELREIAAFEPSRGRPIKFRPQRGGLAEAMAEMVELPNRAALIEHLQKWHSGMHGTPPVNDATVHVKPYGDDRPDERIGWKRTFIVMLDGWGPCGFTDGNFSEGSP